MPIPYIGCDKRQCTVGVCYLFVKSKYIGIFFFKKNYNSIYKIVSTVGEISFKARNYYCLFVFLGFFFFPGMFF